MRTDFRGTARAGLFLIGAVGACDAQVDPGYQGEPLVTLKGQVEALQASPAEADVGVLWLTNDAASGCTGPQRITGTFSSGSYSADVDPACTDACGPVPGSSPEDAAAWERCQRACGADVRAGVIVEYSACASGAVGQTAPVVGNFPAQFSLDVLRPPPAEALLPSDTGEHVALGYFVALAPHAGTLTFSFDDFDAEPPPWLLGGSETHVLVYAADPVPAESSWGLYLGGSYAAGYHLLRVEFGNRCGLRRLDPYSDRDLMPAPDMQPMMDTGGSSAGGNVAGASPELPSAPDYSGVASVCGNGVCEPHEDCEVCSDCQRCEAGSRGASSGITNVMEDYFCSSTPSTLVAAEPGSETDIKLLIARPGLIEWPDL